MQSSPSKPLKPIKPEKVVLDESTIRAHQTSVWRFLRFLGASSELAEDLTQETFLALLKNPPGDEGSEALGRWLRRVAHNEFVSRHRKLRRELEGIAVLDLEAGFVGLSGIAAGPYTGEGYLSALDVCMESLGKRELKLLELRYSEGEGREAIAIQLDMTVEAAKTLLRRTKNKLRHCIEKRLNDDTR